MTRLTGSISLLLFLATVSACDSEKKGCPEGQTECNDGKCHDCCIDDDCTDKVPECRRDYIICNDNYECECVCYKEGEDCSRDPVACCSGLFCDIFTNTCLPECIPCTSDYDCPADLVCSCQYPWEDDCCCIERQPCATDADCSPGEYCANGRCMEKGDCDLKECVVIPAQAVVREGTTAQFSATPYLVSGAVAPGITFSWYSSDSEVAEVVGGLVTGSASTGSATITATPVGCAAIICTAEVYNYGPVSSGYTRVVVVDELTREPVEGATVVIGSEAPAVTNELGFVEVALELGEANPGDITVSKRDYHYVTLMSVKTNDVIIHLSPLYHLDFSQDPPAKQAGGIKGKFDFGMIRCEPPLVTCDVAIGLGGLSFPLNLTNLGVDMLTRGVILTEVQLGGTTELLPCSEGFVWCLNQTCFKEYYTPVGAPGNRVAWGLGGKLDLAAMIDVMGPAFVNGEFDTLEFILGIEPFMGRLYTAMVPNVDIIPRPMVPDINDIDVDPDTFEVPDYDNFPPQDMTLKVGADQLMTFNAPALPVGAYDRLVLIGGVMVRGAGFVPLGLAVGLDSLDPEDPPDGVIEDPIVLDIADVAGRIPEEQVQRVVLAFAMQVGKESPKTWAGQVLFVDSFSGTHTLPGFMLPVDATYDATGRRLEAVQVPTGADFIQLVFSGEDQSSWHILTEDFTSFDLPTAPAEGNRSTELVGVYAVRLETGSYQDLVEFNDLNLGDLFLAVDSFSVRE